MALQLCPIGLLLADLDLGVLVDFDTSCLKGAGFGVVALVTGVYTAVFEGVLVRVLEAVAFDLVAFVDFVESCLQGADGGAVAFVTGVYTAVFEGVLDLYALRLLDEYELLDGVDEYELRLLEEYELLFEELEEYELRLLDFEPA